MSNITIVKIKLLNDGMKGLKYNAESPIIKDNVVIQSLLDTTYPIPIPKDIRSLIQRMKKYLLHMSGHWQDEFDEYISKGEIVDIEKPTPDYYRLIELFQSTRIEELSRFKGKYNIVGYYINKWKFSIKISVSGITIDSGYDNYDKLDTGMKHIFKTVTDFINDRHLRTMEPRQYMLDLWEGKDEMLTRLDGLDDEQVLELQIKVLEEKGCLVMKEDDIEGDDAVEEVVEEKKEEVVEEKTTIPDEKLNNEDLTPVEDI